jgi:N-acetylglucosaminyldiphosphoundecaprenol N-acetyl-beta-D-mannosaminyltransferase
VYWQDRWSALVSRTQLATTQEQADAVLAALAASHTPVSLAFVNAHAFNLCKDNEDFFSDVMASSLILRDGIGVAILLGWLGIEKGMNLNGTDIIPRICRDFQGQKIALFGATQETVITAAEKMQVSGAIVVAAENGYHPDAHYLDSASRHKPRVIILGMGMPKQEHIAVFLKNALGYPVLIVCGGAIIDRMAGSVARAPAVLQRTGLEWLYRFACEPKRLFRRYILGNPKFLTDSAILAAKFRNRIKPEMLMLPEKFEVAERTSHDVSATAAYALENRSQLTLAIPVVSQHAVNMQAEEKNFAVVPQVPETPARDMQGEGFVPGKPVTDRKSLVGRKSELEKLTKAILHKRAHALVYGERGYGKTSLVQVFGEIADEHGYAVIYGTCSRQTTYAELLGYYIKELITAKIVPADTQAGSASGMAAILAAVREQDCLFIIDEYDRIECTATRENIVELAKTLSDTGGRVQLLLVGVAASAEELTGLHPSIHRHVAVIPIRRLSAKDIIRLVREKCLIEKIGIADHIVNDISTVVAGSAYHAQLFGQSLIMNARSRNETDVNVDDLSAVLAEHVDDECQNDPELAIILAACRDSPAHMNTMAILAQEACASSNDSIDLNLLLSNADEAMIAGIKAYCLDLMRVGVLQQLQGAKLSYGNANTLPLYRFTNAFNVQTLKTALFLIEKAECCGNEPCK